jgi:hypothetical protein
MPIGVVVRVATNHSRKLRKLKSAKYGLASTLISFSTQTRPYPLRVRGDLVFRIVAPRDVFGAPHVEAILVDEYIRGVPSQTARDSWKLIDCRSG